MLADLDRVDAGRVGEDEVARRDLWVAHQPVGARAPLLIPAQVGHPGEQGRRRVAGRDLDLRQHRLDLSRVVGHDELHVGRERGDGRPVGRGERFGFFTQE